MKNIEKSLACISEKARRSEVGEACATYARGKAWRLRLGIRITKGNDGSMIEHGFVEAVMRMPAEIPGLEKDVPALALLKERGYSITFDGDYYICEISVERAAIAEECARALAIVKAKN